MRNKSAAFGAGAAIGTLGGLIGLGGAEFRLPLLIGLFNFRGLEAVILNKAKRPRCRSVLAPCCLPKLADIGRLS